MGKLIQKAEGDDFGKGKCIFQWNTYVSSLLFDLKYLAEKLVL